MLEFNKHTRLGISHKTLRLLSVVLLLLNVMISILVVKQVYQARIVAQQIEEEKKRSAILKRENDQWQAEYNLLRGEKNNILIMQKRLNMVKPQKERGRILIHGDWLK